jgi:RND superfamily putative drug exporter
MFARWGGFVVRARWAIMAGAVALVAIGATWGAGVFGHLASGGFLDTTTKSGQARAQIDAAFGPQDADILVLYRSTMPVTDPAVRGPVAAALAAARARPEVANVVDYYTTPNPALVSKNGRETYAIVKLRAGTDTQKLADYRAVKSVFVVAPNPTATSPNTVATELGGLRSFYDDSNVLTKSDIEHAEALSMPILLILLVLIFRSVVAALTPLVVGGLAILGGLIVVRLLTSVTTVSTFAINIITLIGLGLSIDYALFVVSRFREEIAAGKPTSAAVVRTMATAGRTVAVSGVTVTLALAGLLLFPQVFLRSMAYGAMSAVVVAMFASLTVLPAGLALLGPRINAWRVPLPRLRRTTAAADGAWARLAHSVMRRPWFYLVGVLIVLAVLAAPVAHIRFGGIDTRSLPPSAPSRAVNDTITRDFPPTDAAPVQVIVVGVDQAAIATVLAEIKAVPSVTAATVTDTSTPTRPTATPGTAAPGTATPTTALITVDYQGSPTDAAARDAVTEIRALPTPPAGGSASDSSLRTVHIGVTGTTADLIDQLDGLGSRLPWMALFVVVVTSLLLFLAFGSVVLPIKAILMNAVSLGAAFGAVVFIFQDGHFASWLGFTPTGVIEPTNPILMIAVLFGLATDYEVFLLSRIREEWDLRTRGTVEDLDLGAANRESVAIGLQRTGRIITSAALLLVIVVVGFASGQIAFVKLIGIGMVVAIVVDATLVRALLVPATMRLLGRWNWWAPGPFGKIYRQYGLRETVPAAEGESVSTPT